MILFCISTPRSIILDKTLSIIIVKKNSLTVLYGRHVSAQAPLSLSLYRPSPANLSFVIIPPIQSPTVLAVQCGCGPPRVPAAATPSPARWGTPA
jgi:hypothetical protein